MLNWLKQFSIFCLLDNNGYSHNQPEFEMAIAVGVKNSITLKDYGAFESLKAFYDKEPRYLFGHFGYELKDQLFNLKSANKPYVDFGHGFFFEPEILLFIKDNALTIISEGDTEAIFQAIENQSGSMHVSRTSSPAIQSDTLEQYKHSIAHIKQHIKLGDCYELNFCRFFEASKTIVDPFSIFHELNAASPSPFAAFYRMNDLFCMCASPERYLKKSGSKILSQPMKGTARRDLSNTSHDEARKEQLFNSSKERSENVMIVDLVRNDLSRIAAKGSVKVEEMFGIYSFPHVHQMISTVSAELAAEKHFIDAIAVSFPMGSMTGAPKKRVLELIGQYESGERGLFSGSIGYITPNRDFDFNVVIRSIFFDSKHENLAFMAGGAITYYADYQEEYAETELKAKAIKEVLGVF